MSKAKTHGATANEITEAAKKTRKGKEASKAPARFGEADPRTLYIVGLDAGFKKGEPGYNAELFEPDRIATAPAPDFVKGLQANPDKIDPVCVILANHPDLGEVKVIAKGRQRTMGARLLTADDPDFKIWYFVQPKSDALDVTRENEYRKRRTPLEKANHAARLAGMGYKEAQILSSFSDDGAKQITKMTLINWKRAANCVPPIQARCEAGDFPITVCYEIGKIGYNDDKMSLEERTHLQLEALAKAEAEGTLKGTKGRANSSAAATGKDDEDSDDDAPESGDKGPRGKSRRLSPEAIGELISRFEPDEDEENEGYSDLLKKDGKVYCPHTYTDGDFQKLAYALLTVVNGDDETGEALQEFPSVHRWVKRYLRSPKAE